MAKCVIHDVELDELIIGRLGCLICWKNKKIVENLDTAIEKGLPHNSFDQACCEGTNEIF